MYADNPSFTPLRSVHRTVFPMACPIFTEWDSLCFGFIREISDATPLIDSYVTCLCT